MKEFKQEKCPYCGEMMDADFVDVEVGWVQCGPYHCDCGACEIGPNDDHSGMTEEEKETGYWRGRIGSSANQIEGKVVTHKEADAKYRSDYFAENGNPFNAPVARTICNLNKEVKCSMWNE